MYNWSEPQPHSTTREHFINDLISRVRRMARTDSHPDNWEHLDRSSRSVGKQLHRAAYPTVRFRDLAQGDLFEFNRDNLPDYFAHAMPTGPWVKVSPWRYARLSNRNLVFRIGAVSTRVIRA